MGSEHLPLGRVVGRWLGIVPLERGRIAMRAEGGAVLAKDSARIPGALLFRTGGDTTVRGYGYRDIGIKLDNGVTGPGRYMAVGSVEYQRPMMKDGRPSEWENTFFIDAGSVADNPKDMKPSVGIGTGVRWRSPIGPAAD
jgi:translocation and assembly module TamA